VIDAHEALPKFEFHDSPASHLKPKTTVGNLNVLGYAGQVGYAVAGPIIVGALGGFEADKRFGTGQRYTTIGLGLGAIIGMVGFIGLVKEMSRKRL
jgi:hypothetical protein